jgi:hypothetical protein
LRSNQSVLFLRWNARVASTQSRQRNRDRFGSQRDPVQRLERLPAKIGPTPGIAVKRRALSSFLTVSRIYPAFQCAPPRSRFVQRALPKPYELSLAISRHGSTRTMAARLIIPTRPFHLISFGPIGPNRGTRPKSHSQVCGAGPSTEEWRRCCRSWPRGGSSHPVLCSL